MNCFTNFEDFLQKFNDTERSELERVLYGGPQKECENIDRNAVENASMLNIQLKSAKFCAQNEQLRPKRVTRVGLAQFATPLAAICNVYDQMQAFRKLASDYCKLAAGCNVNILCFQEAWNMPFGFLTGQKMPWLEYAECAETGRTTNLLKQFAKLYKMVIISPILERDSTKNDTIWNTAVVIDETGNVMGKHRKNHIPRVGNFNESKYYMEGDTGHPVFETSFGKIAINICYGRHHPLNWQMFGLNGAEIIFNPSATTGELSEHLWGVEARNAAIANSCYTCAINRVGTEWFENDTSYGHFFGSSYVTAPDGKRSYGLSRTENGLLVADLDLNLCRQTKDSWGFAMTARLDMYAKRLQEYLKPDFKPQIIRSISEPNQ